MTIKFYFEYRDFIPWFPKNDEFSFCFIKALAKSQDTNRELICFWTFLAFYQSLEDYCHPQNDMLDSFV